MDKGQHADVPNSARPIKGDLEIYGFAVAQSWTTIDWDAPRPDGRGVVRSLSRLRYEITMLPRPGVDPSCLRCVIPTATVVR
jgi:hypothetical protein